MGNKQWGLKDVLAPVISRMIIYGVNQFDIELVIKKLSNTKLLHSRVLEENWWQLWHNLAHKYRQKAEEAEMYDNTITARDMYFLASGCYYSASLVNYINLEKKKQIYLKYAETYKKSIQFASPPIKPVTIPITDKINMPAYIYLPRGNTPAPCVILITGIGTSKEETHVFAKPLVERGIAVLTPDIPGIGESLFHLGLKFHMGAITQAISASLDFLQDRSDIDPEKIGITGICMGGALAFKLAAGDKRFKACATLFPLQIDAVDKSKIPRWMHDSKWSEYFLGPTSNETIEKDTRISDNEGIECPFFMVHSKDDNWMPLEKALVMAEKAKGDKKIIILEEEAIFGNEQMVIHTLPVAEQCHWIKHLMADWVKANLC